MAPHLLRPAPEGSTKLTRVYVTANRISNTSLEVDVRPTSTALDLKYQIEERWKVPAICQKLMMGMSVVRDADKLAAHRKPGAAGLSVTMVIILDYVLQELASNEECKRQAALAALAQLGSAGGEGALAAVEVCLEDRKADVRYAALRVLPLVAEADDPAAVAAVCRRLEDKDIGVRHAASEVLLQLATKGNEIAVTLLCQKLEHHDCAVRNAAVEVLGKLTDKGDEVAMWEVGLRLESQSSGVRRAALRALARVSPDGHEGAIAAIRMFVEDPDAGVRKAAAAALVEVGTPLYPPLDPDCQQAYDMLMEMRDEYVLELALTAPDDVALEVSNIDGRPLLDANARVVTCPNGHGLIPLCVSCDDGWICDGSRHPAGCRSGITDFYQTAGMERFRCGACNYDLCQKCVDMKAEVYGGAHARSMKALASALSLWRCHPVIMGKNGEPVWRPELSNGEEDPAIAAALTNGDRHLEDIDEEMPPLLDAQSGAVAHESEGGKEDEEDDDDDLPPLLEVSQCAREEKDAGDDLPGLVEVDVAATAAVEHAIADSVAEAADADNWREREAALQALAMDGERGDPATIAAVSRGLGDVNERVRRTALEVLAEVVEAGDADAMRAICGFLKNANIFIRRDAVTALALVSERGDENSIAMVAECLQDSHSCVRNSARKALAILVDHDEIEAMGLVSATQESACDDAQILMEEGIAQVQVAGNRGERLVTAMSHRLEKELNQRSRQALQHALVEAAANEAPYEMQEHVEHQSEIIGCAALLAVAEMIAPSGSSGDAQFKPHGC